MWLLFFLKNVLIVSCFEQKRLLNALNVNVNVRKQNQTNPRNQNEIRNNRKQGKGTNQERPERGIVRQEGEMKPGDAGTDQNR